MGRIKAIVGLIAGSRRTQAKTASSAVPLVFLIGFLSPPDTSATTLQKLELDYMIRQSSAIVRARVVGASAVVRAGDVFTLYHLDIAETLKPQNGQPLAELAVRGGVAGGIRQSVPGTPALYSGTDYVLFLWTGRSGLTQLMGLSQGVFTLKSAADGDAQALQAASTARMLDADGQSLHGPGFTLKLSELRMRVAESLAPDRGARGRK